ncbi:MAG: PQQ-binding-like beta-propeller repeat protein [Candidatus Bathyarchaeia archaeon]
MALPGSGTETATVNAQTTTISSNLLQYEWPNPTSGDTKLGYRATSGPAPSSQDVLWKSNLGTPVSAFNGKLFLSGGNVVDPFTGTLLYRYTNGSNPTKINEQLFFTTITPPIFSSRAQPENTFVYDTSTGQLLYTYNLDATNYDPTLGMFWQIDPQSGGNGGGHRVRGYNWPVASQPPVLAWDNFVQKGIGSLLTADGRLLIGTLGGTVLCLDGKTGITLWEIPIEGYLGYSGSYYDGKFIQASLDGRIYCFDVKAGKILWSFYPGTFFAYFANMGAIYDGKIYNVCTDYYTYCLDINTGALVWKWKSDQGVGYQTTTIAGDGKVYAYTGRTGYTDPNTNAPYKDEYVCLNSTTGEVIWKTDLVNGGTGGGPPAVNNILAYGNLYLRTKEANCVCYAQTQPWSSFHGNSENTGNGNRNGPEDLVLKWTFNAGSWIMSSPAAAEGKIYIGAYNGILYALDHLTGNPVWQFKTGDSVRSSPAYDKGRVYFCSDDGYQYCLSASDGAVIWKTYIGSDVPYYYHGLQSQTASPKVVGDSVYIGSRNNTFYCLNAANGNVKWKIDAGGLISNAPAVSGNAVYISVGGLNTRWQDDTGGPNGTMYKLDATTGNTIWKTGLPYFKATGGYMVQLIPRELHGSPVVVGDWVFQSANGWATYGINATTGQIVWNFTTALSEEATTGALPNDITPVYANGRLYVQDFFRLACVNATNGKKIWDQWLGHSVHGGPLYADGKVYVASELKAMWVLNAETGEKYDSYTWDHGCWSSPCVYDGKLYWGNLGMMVYCFEQAPYGVLTYSGKPQAEPLPAQTQTPAPASTPTPIPIATPAATQTPPPAPIATATPVPTATPLPAVEPSAAASNTVLYVGIAVIVIVVVIAAVAVVLRRRK